MDEIWKTRRSRTARAVTAFLAAGLLPATASADPLPVLQQAGHLGRWAVSCEAPPSPQNIHMVYYDAGGGRVRRRLERGADLPALDGAGDRALTVRSVDKDGRELINDGKYMNGRPVPTLTRCPEPPRS